MVSSTSLTDDILIEIFTYLPLNSIYKFKCLSKVWLSNLSDPSFMIKWFEINNKSLPWIHYHTVTYHYLQADENHMRFQYAYPELYSDFISKNEHLFAFKFLLNKKPFQEAKLFLLGSSNGLALCLSFPTQCEMRRYYVCNPLTQKWVSLPKPPGTSASYLDFTGIFCEYSSSFACCYKVVRIPVTDKRSKKFNVDIFSSGLGVWQTIEVLCDEFVAFDNSKYYNVIIINDVLFFIEGGDKMIVYNLNQENESDGHRCSLINLPADEEFDDDYGGDFDSILGESQGRVCYARIRITERGVTVSVWVLNEVNWQILHNCISIGDCIFTNMKSETGEDAPPFKVLGFSPVDHNVVLISCKHRVWGFNIQTRNYEELCLDNKHGYHEGRLFRPFVLTPMPTVLPPPSWIEEEIIPNKASQSFYNWRNKSRRRFCQTYNIPK